MFTVTNPVVQAGITQLLLELSEDTQKFDDILREHHENCDTHEVRLVISTMMSCLYEWLDECEKENKEN